MKFLFHILQSLFNFLILHINIPVFTIFYYFSFLIFSVYVFDLYYGSPLFFYVYSDITALAKDRAYTHINLNELTIHQVTIFFFGKPIARSIFTLQYYNRTNLFFFIKKSLIIVKATKD